MNVLMCLSAFYLNLFQNKTQAYLVSIRILKIGKLRFFSESVFNCIVVPFLPLNSVHIIVNMQLLLLLVLRFNNRNVQCFRLVSALILRLYLILSHSNTHYTHTLATNKCVTCQLYNNISWIWTPVQIDIQYFLQEGIFLSTPFDNKYHIKLGTLYHGPRSKKTTREMHANAWYGKNSSMWCYRNCMTHAINISKIFNSHLC